MRYAASEFGMLLGDDALRVAKDMKHAQDDLGAYCDALVNLQMIDEFPREGLSLAGRRQLYQLAERNAAYLEEALAGFQAKQREAADSAAYASPKSRSALCENRSCMQSAMCGSHSSASLVRAMMGTGV